MANLLGDLWVEAEPNWLKLLEFPNVKLHLYGKLEPRKGRKMGHLTAIYDSSEKAVKKVIAARKSLY
jgi:5-(carboxyamino)imidazole ribonucleotide synthase